MSWLPSPYTPGLISVVIATHRRPLLLRQTALAMLAQTYRPLELCIVSDGDCSETADTVDQLCRDWPQEEIRYEAIPPQGAPAARNHGARKATGEYLVFMDDDDLAAPDFLECRHATASRGHDLTFGPYEEFVVSNDAVFTATPHWQLPSAENNHWKAFLAGWNLLLQGCLLSRSLVEKTGPWDESLAKSQDFDYKVRLLQHAGHVGACREGHVYYRRHRQNISRANSPHIADSIAAAVRKCRDIAQQRDDFAECQPFVADRLWHFGKVLLRRGYATQARELFRDAIEVDATVTERKSANEVRCYRWHLLPLLAKYLAFVQSRKRLAIERTASPALASGTLRDFLMGVEGTP